MPEEDYHFTPLPQLMQPDEILGIAAIFVRMGVKKIRLTGGEPLVRKDAAKIMENLATLPVTLGITTNGIRADEFMPVFTASGIRTINISLDTLDAGKFHLLTRRNYFHRVYNNIQSLIAAGFHVKVNMVVMRGINEKEIPDFIRWTEKQPVSVRFIEFMPFSGNHWHHDKVFSMDEMLGLIQQEFPVERLQDALHDTDKKFQVPGYAGNFAMISTMTHPFCDTCNRMRLTADGKLKNCLFSRTETDLLGPYRAGEPIDNLILANIMGKAKALGGQINTDYEHLDADTLANRSMITIGG
ncbi:molybdenum cofactor biosynthesis protein [Flavihumibacter petaseus NBRC 106054]|uniref:Molybdenum cofactor biosynthesis protein n=2 Tax=Flavihumibacter TaxID=1004301 RepID=A0A0E9N3N0_9BACT|nr:molybdenum cofactor biosynthesis protein [Flavihumibacter petaseus NBRC 106054]